MYWLNFVNYVNTLPIWAVYTKNGTYYVPAETKEDAIVGIKDVMRVELYPI